MAPDFGQSVVLLILTIVFVVIARRHMWRVGLPAGSAWFLALPSVLLIALTNLLVATSAPVLETK